MLGECNIHDVGETAALISISRCKHTFQIDLEEQKIAAYVECHWSYLSMEMGDATLI